MNLTSKQTLLSFVIVLKLMLIAPGTLGQELLTDVLKFKSVLLDINGKKREVEFADTFVLRAQGLQFRTEMCEECGMLFQFDRTRIVSMWMKNTLIPLDVAFFTEAGEIIDIKQMKPLDLTSVPSSKPVFYALEMNEGWFAKNGIEEGDTIKILSTGTGISKTEP